MHHYIIIILIITVIVIIQLYSFVDTKRKIAVFLWIFPKDNEKYKLEKDALIDQINSSTDDEIDDMLEIAGIDKNKYHLLRINANNESIPVFQREKAKSDLINKLSATAVGISTFHENHVLNTIVGSINDYLNNNKAVTDFHLLKDIVDRNCDSKEDEIETQTPIPLYLGLVGTMAGILIGILYLWLSGGIADLLSSGSNILSSGVDSGAAGVEALLGGVALAMISSILGIILTTWSSNAFKTAKSQVESNKHLFLSWIQAKLLPTLSDNVVGAIREMTDNLTNFNSKFAENTGNLGVALSKVNESYKIQVQLLDLINKIADKDLTHQNLQLYNALQNSSTQIGTLAEYLENTNDYLANVRSLNEKLDSSEQRTKAIEEMAKFFKNEILQVEQRKDIINQSVGSIDSLLEERLRKLSEHASENVEKFNNKLGVIDSMLEERIRKMSEHAVENVENFNKALVKQQDTLQRKLDETELIVTELKNLSSIKDSIAKFEKSTSEQNRRLESLARSIEKLANVKANSSTTNTADLYPKWIKIAAITSFAIITVSSALIAGITVYANNNQDNSQPEYILPTNTIPIINDSIIVVDTID